MTPITFLSSSAERKPARWFCCVGEIFYPLKVITLSTR